MTFDGRIEARFVVPSGVSFLANAGPVPLQVTVPPGAYYLTELVAQLQARLNVVPMTPAWEVAVSLGANGTGRVSFRWSGTGTYAITWTAAGAALRELLGFAGDIAATTAGTTTMGAKHARGLWLPDCPLNLAGDVPRAPITTDAMATVSPRGDATVLVGNSYFRHTGLRYAAVLNTRAWEAATLIPNASWETFWRDVQLGQGFAWFAPGSLLQVYDHAGRKLGADAHGGAGVAGWVATQGPFAVEPKKAATAWAGLWIVEIPELVASG